MRDDGKPSVMKRQHHRVKWPVPTLLAVAALFLAWGEFAAAQREAENQLGAKRFDGFSHPDTAGRPSLPFSGTISEGVTTVFLPMVTTDYHPPPGCSIFSPFSIEIADLEPLRQDSSPRGATVVDSQAHAAWLGRVDQGFPSLLQALKESGACWTRVRIGWDWAQPDPPPSEYVWDDRIRIVAESGIQIIGLIEGVPAWAGSSGYGPIAPERLGDLANFVTDAVNRYKQPPYNIRTWEILNEPDRVILTGDFGYGAHGDQYAQVLMVTYNAIKAADPEAKVIMGGIAHDWFLEYQGPFNRYFPDDVMLAGGDQYLDAFNIHYFPDYRQEWERWVPEGTPPTCGDVEDGLGVPYLGGGIDLIAKVRHFENRMATCFGVSKPMWITEMGEHGYRVAPDDPEDPTKWLRRQAQYVIKGYTRGLAMGVENMTWFVLVSPYYDANEQGLLFEDDWSPKPAYYAYQTLTYELEGYRFQRSIEAPGAEAYLFSNVFDEEKTVAWWNQPWPPRGSLVFAPARQLRVVNRWGDVSIILDGGPGDLDMEINSAVELGLSAEPVFVTPKQ
jgi:hypothetical protein